MEDMATRSGGPRRSRCRGVGELPRRPLGQHQLASGGSSGVQAAGFFRRNHDDHGCRRWIVNHHDHGRLGSSSTTTTCRAADRRRRRRFDIVDGRGRTCTRAPGSDPAEGQLDQPHLHHDRCWLEHRLGLQLCTGAGLGTLVAGVRDAGRVVTHGNARNQRDRAIRTVGHRADQPRRANVGGSGPCDLHMGREGHRLLAIPRRRRLALGHRSGPVCAGRSEIVRSAFSGVGFRVPQTGQFDDRAHRRSCSFDQPVHSPARRCALRSGWRAGRGSAPRDDSAATNVLSAERAASRVGFAQGVNKVGGGLGCGAMGCIELSWTDHVGIGWPASSSTWCRRVTVTSRRGNGQLNECRLATHCISNSFGSAATHRLKMLAVPLLESQRFAACATATLENR